MKNINQETIRADFPLLATKVRDRQLIYLDNAATTQKPTSVLQTIDSYYRNSNANVHRGVHFLSNEATQMLEEARKTTQQFINAKEDAEIIFTRGTTEAINLVASSFGKSLAKDDEIIVSEMEHHSNIVPWQLTALEHQATIKVLPFDDLGELMIEKLEQLITSKTRIIAITHVSNALGTINPIKKIINLAHSHAIPVLVDGAQAIAHTKVDVSELDCDFYCFSGHKIYAPMGVGVLYGKRCWLDALPPYQGGGEMIKQVSFSGTTFNDLPYKFEAGTPSVADILGLKAALDYVNDITLERIEEIENSLLDYATTQLQTIDCLRIIGQAKQKAGVISFLIDGIHPFDLGTLLDQLGIAIRTGHHCAQPVMEHFGITGTARVSLAVYNTQSEIDFFISALQKVILMLR
ncbi:MAG: cysteine desulfurase [Bacteroidales bacterium]|jgi:cysteine desulfurase/selenocysteine lyase|nr:cysteine desulfurase [Bacteroidales bacterium]